MRRLLKFQMPDAQVGTIALPVNCTIVHAAVQHSNICLWAEVFTDESGKYHETHDMHYQWVPTGAFVPEGVWQHVTTILIADGNLVWHLYRRVD